MKLTRTLAVAAAALTLVGVSACGGSNRSDAKQLELVSWWTSGSEAQALSVLTDAFHTTDPDVEVVNATVVGGAGSNARVALATRLLTGNPPDVWQAFPAATLQSYVAQGQVADISKVIEDSGMSKALPQVILDGLTVNGKQYAMPTSSHRGNMLFYNLAVLKKAGVAAPGANYSTDDWLKDMNKVKAAGVTPLCLGAKDAFTTPALFENILLSVVGTQGWNSIAADQFNWRGPGVQNALETFNQTLKLADPAAAAMSWDQATKKLGQGGCAYEVMNDSAYGELVKQGGVDGKTFSQAPFPETGQSYVAVVDTFVQAKATPHNPKYATDFQTDIADPTVQLNFSAAKGSVPVRTDVDVSSLSAYQQSAATALRNDQVLWSIVYGELMSPTFQTGFYDAVNVYARTQNAKAFSDTVINAVAAAPPQR